MAGVSRNAASIVALLLALLGAVATEMSEQSWWRYPCDGQEGWDPAEPLTLRFAATSEIDPDTPGLLEGIRVLDPDGGQVPLVLAVHDGGRVVACPVGGLEPETDYTWRIGPFHESHNHLEPPAWGVETESRFTTGPGWPEEVIGNRADCEAWAPPDLGDDPCADTGGTP